MFPDATQAGTSCTFECFETTAIDERAGFVLLKARATVMAVEIGWQRKLVTGAPGEKKLTTLLAVNKDPGPAEAIFHWSGLYETFLCNNLNEVVVAQRAREGFALVKLGPSRGVRGHAPPGNFGFLDAPECNFRLFGQF